MNAIPSRWDLVLAWAVFGMAGLGLLYLILASFLRFLARLLEKIDWDVLPALIWGGVIGLPLFVGMGYVIWWKGVKLIFGWAKAVWHWLT